MQQELNSFFRTLRIQWLFHEKPDERSELETKFYMKSDWMPPKASVELEQFIHHIQIKFDAWKPPRWISDNVSKEERSLIHKIRREKETVYMWEDKGASFTKMHIDQYIDAGENG